MCDFFFIANCSSIGKKLLQEQGNVVDAGIAALLCLGVVHPHTAGLGQYCVLFITSPSFTNQIFQGHSLGWSEQKVNFSVL